jgi:hypothetical protein
MPYQMWRNTQTYRFAPIDEPVPFTGEADNFFLPHISDHCRDP